MPDNAIAVIIVTIFLTAGLLVFGFLLFAGEAQDYYDTYGYTQSGGRWVTDAENNLVRGGIRIPPKTKYSEVEYIKYKTKVWERTKENFYVLLAGCALIGTFAGMLGSTLGGAFMETYPE